MFINLSNHKSESWETAQLEAAQKYGEIIDIPFPSISPTWNNIQVDEKVYEYLNKIIHEAKKATDQVVIHIAGEPVFCFNLINILISKGYTILTSTTERMVVEKGQEKTSTFKFVTFREYTKTKENIQLPRIKSLLHSNAVICFMMVALLIIEFSLAKIMKNYVYSTEHFFPNWGYPYPSHCTLNIIIFVVSTLFIITAIVGISLKTYKFTSLTIRKLITNALGFKWLSLLFILCFMMQLTWFIDAGKNIFMDAEISLHNFTEGIKMAISFGAIFVISSLFPKISFPDKELKTETRTLLVSTISLFSKQPDSPTSTNTSLPKISSPNIRIINLELFNKLLNEEIYKSGDTISIGKLTNIEKILIIPSNELFGAQFDDKTNKEFSGNDAFIKFQQESNIEIRKIHLAECFKIIIKQKMNKDITVFFTESTNYDNFDKFFQIVNRDINYHENKKTDATAVYISPGTKAATGALSILGIKGSRMVIYAEQGGSNKLCSININAFSLEELLNELWGEHENYEKA